MKKPNSISRRQFLQYVGGSAAGAALIGAGAYSWRELFETIPQAHGDPGPGIEDFKVTLCGGCSGGCSLVVRRVDGRAVGIRGNPLYPLNRGHVCPRGLARLQHLYNPDRIKSPLRRVHHRGDGKWEEISWDNALEEIGKSLSDLGGRGLAHQVVMLADRLDGIDMDLAERFMEAYGSPNFIAGRAYDTARMVLRNLYGDHYAVGYDIENSNYLLCFDDVLGTGSSPVWAQGAFAYLRQERTGLRPRIIYVGSRMNLTAANADEWVSVRPGTEGALALGVAHLIIQQHLYDQDFVAKYTHGFEAWTRGGQSHIGFRQHVMDNYSPRRVSEITGVPIHTIVKIADEFGRYRPAVAIGGYQPTETTNSFYNLTAIHALNGLVGSIDRAGGVINQEGSPLSNWPAINPDAQARRSREHPRLDRLSPAVSFPQVPSSQAFLESLASREPYPVELLINCNANPIYEEWNGSGYNRSYDQVKLMVSLSPFMDDTARYSDIVLPIHVDFESWGYGDTVGGTSFRAHLALRQPVVEPLHNTLQSGDVLIRLAGLLGGTVADAMSWPNSLEALKSRLQGIAEADEGVITSGSHEKKWLQSLAGLGWRSPGFDGSADFQRQLSANGGWWNPLYDSDKWKSRFSTPSGKFEFASLSLLESFRSAFKASTDPLTESRRHLRLEATKDELILPHYEPPEFDGDQNSYPLVLVPYYTVGLGDGEGANLPLMVEFIDPLSGPAWETVVELHRDAALSADIHDGADVWVESPHGRIRCRAKVSTLNRPDIACIALGLGHRGYGRFADGIGVNPKAIIAKKFDRMGGTPALVATRVRILKA